MAQVSRDAPLVAAIIVGRSNALDGAAAKTMRSIRRVAEEHRLTGNYISKLAILNVPGERGRGRLVRDRLIVADDEAVGAIEWGHLIRFKNSRRVKYVPGLHIMRRGLEGA